jgi:hydrogenase-4 component B
VADPADDAPKRRRFPPTGVKIVFALCGAGLALTAALAVTCFVKAFSMSFLGMTRSSGARKAREISRSMLIPMAILAIFCLLLGILPTYTIPILDKSCVTSGAKKCN